MTTVYIDPLIAACLSEFEEIIGDHPWVASNEVQRSLLERLTTLKDLLRVLPTDIIKTIGSSECSKVNDFLRSRGFPISLTPEGPGSLYAAAVLDLIVHWDGSPFQLYDGNKEIPAIELSKDQFHVRGGDVLVPKVSGTFQVALTEATDLASGMKTIQDAWGMSPEEDWDKARFPMVDLSVPLDLSSMVGLEKGGYMVSQAIGHAMLTLDPKGARAQAAAAFRKKSFSLSRNFNIRGPFVIAFLIEGHVVLAYHVTREHFKPADLDDNDQP